MVEIAPAPANAQRKNADPGSFACASHVVDRNRSKVVRIEGLP